MDVIHVTLSNKLSSIMKNGIFRSKPVLDKYDEIMEENYGSDYDKDKGMVFGFSESINHRDRIIKDFFYWKTWGDVRNRFLKSHDYNQFNKLQEMGTKVFSHIKLTPLQFSVLLIDIPHEEIFDFYRHQQSADMGVLWKDMETRYEHNDKPLNLINYDVKPDQIKEVIGIGESILKRNNKIDVLLNMKRREKWN